MPADRPPISCAQTVLRGARTVVTLGLLAAWVIFARPVYLGGDTNFVLVSGQSMLPTLKQQDLVVTRRQDRYKVGDIIVYRIPNDGGRHGARVIHRVIERRGPGYRTQGDNRDHPDLWIPTASDIDGRQIAVVPQAGKVMAFMRSPLMLALGLTLSMLLAFLTAGARTREQQRDAEDDSIPEPLVTPVYLRSVPPPAPELPEDDSIPEPLVTPVYLRSVPPPAASPRPAAPNRPRRVRQRVVCGMIGLSVMVTVTEENRQSPDD